MKRYYDHTIKLNDHIIKVSSIIIYIKKYYKLYNIL